MPALTLVVCVHQQRELLERLLRETAGCFDELLVIHDIPDSTNIREVVVAAGGRFFELPPSTLQEPHWPFAWGEAKHDWILRLDADEYPGEELKAWLKRFRTLPEPDKAISGFTCIWPLWNMDREVTKKWPTGRLFLFRRQQVRFFGMCEQSPIPDGKCEALDMILHHSPPGRKTYGLGNMLWRRQSRRGHEFISQCLLGKPTDLNCWRWESEAWPPVWEHIRLHPLRTALRSVTIQPLRTLRDLWRTERRIMPDVAISAHIFHARLCIMFWRLKNSKAAQARKAKTSG